MLSFSCPLLAQENNSSENNKEDVSLENKSAQSTVVIKEKKKPPIDTSHSLEVVYGSSPWNKDSTKIDNAELFVRDAQSGNVLKILLEETEPDSSTFSGNFAVGWAKDKEIKPEVYIPPENIRGKEPQLNKFVKQIRDGKIARKPIVYKKGKSGEQLLDVYDTKEQAQSALEAYKEKIKQEEVKVNLEQPTKVVAKADLEAASLAAKQTKLAELALLAASREEERIRKEQLERQRSLERLRVQQELKEKEKEKRRSEAKMYAEQALEAYKQGDFLKAEELFKKSVDLDPSDTSYYFRYGVTLYRNEKFDDALVVLKITNVDETTDIEKSYYMGLIHFRLKELQSALQQFTKVRNSKHEIMSPSAAFYEGVIYYTDEKYEEAKTAFEFVLDTSKDARLDEKAEEYLEKIAYALIFKKKQEHKHDLALSLGLNYDSNILFSPDNQEDQGSATNSSGLRMLETISYQYRALYKKEFEWTLDLMQLYIYSFNSDLQVADPLIASIKSPVTWKGVWGEKGYKLSIKPGYENLFMDTDVSAATNPPTTNLLSSILFDVDFTLIMNENWFSNYILESRLDDSKDPASTGDDDADSTLVTLKTSQIFFKDKSKKKALIWGGGYTLNGAKGDNKVYNKILLNFAYSQPFKAWKEATWNTSLDLYQLDYSKLSTGRTDTNYAIGYSISKVQNKWFTWGSSFSYTTNNSTVNTNQYTKYNVLLTASFDIDEWMR
ncbi:MAG: hypothetical protein H6625_02420 [Bdellovibrionaceae bacterium]|nr:hypothetical protein [Pseudobdellovibrionaceae bacterium]